MRPLRVCIEGRTPNAATGGVQQFIIGLVSGLSRLVDGDEEYVVLGDDQTDEWLGGHLGGGCRIERMAPPGPAPRRSALRRALGRLAAPVVTRAAKAPLLCRLLLPPVPRSSGTLERLAPDVVHFTTQSAFLTRVPSIYHPHDLQHVHLPHLFARADRCFRERTYRAFCRQAAMVAVVSSWTREDVIAHYALDPAKVQVVPFAPVTLAYAAPTEAESRALLAARRLPDRFVFYPAQTWPHKNHAALLEALAQLKARGLVVPLVSSGHKNAHHAVLEARARELGVGDLVHFLGFVTPAELQSLYRRCVAVVIPSLFEAASFPLWEAFQAGVPAACSNVTSLPAQAGDSALVFDPHDVTQIAEAVARLWTDEILREELAARGRRNVARFSWDRTARMFRAHYRRLAGRALDPSDEALLTAAPLL
jgi:glycosyltransferase involved in cell wall biosynthesis